MATSKDLQAQYDLLNEKVQRLKMALIIETDEAERFKLEKQIAEMETALSEIQKELQPEELLAVENSVNRHQLAQQQGGGLFGQLRTGGQHLSKEGQQAIVIVIVILVLIAVGVGIYQIYQMTRPAEELLLEAAQQGDFNGVKAALARKPDVNARDGWQKTTALMYATEKGRIDLMELLFQQVGLDVNARDKRTDGVILCGRA